jgi:SAM-dependent methyltransferase
LGVDGSVAPDGSPVDLYLLLPERGEAEIVHAAVPDGAEILELGSGPGRVTHELIRLGHPVVAVDESREMLAHVRGAETVFARIEELALGRRFPCVLLMSNLVNSDDDRRAFLAACARHVAPDGVVLVERHAPDWRPQGGKSGKLGDLEIELEDVEVDGPIVSATVRYEAAGRVWRHPFRAHILDDDELAAELTAAGLEFVRTLDDRGEWVEAKLA